MALELTPEQQAQALEYGGKLYEAAVHQRNTYRSVLKAVVAEHGDEGVLTIPLIDGAIHDEPDEALQFHPQDNHLIVKLV